MCPDASWIILARLMAPPHSLRTLPTLEGVALGIVLDWNGGRIAAGMLTDIDKKACFWPEKHLEKASHRRGAHTGGAELEIAYRECALGDGHRSVFN